MKVSELEAVNVEAENKKEDAVYVSTECAPFRIWGVFKGEDGFYHRMPSSVAEKVSPGVHTLATNTAGGRIRFVTDSPYVSVFVRLGSYMDRVHFSKLGSCGVDVYDGVTFKGTCFPELEHTDSYHATVNLGEGMHDVTVNMPLYANVKEIIVGLKKDAEISHAPLYKYDKPVVFYGSSITQGACASRAGTCYQAFLTRALDFDYINLGFSGNAKAEDAMIDYIKGLDMSVFVYDYDHNAPTPEHLANTHEKMFLAVRKAHPDMPIIIMSRPSADDPARLVTIKRTYENAILRGDKNVYLIDGANLNAKSATADGCHPSDLGFYIMATALEPVLKKALEDSFK